MSEQKPDGWVAWHPGHGVEVDLLKDNQRSAEDELTEKHRSDGWRVRPVRLQFLDEPQGDGWIKCSERLPEVSDEYLIWPHDKYAGPIAAYSSTGRDEIPAGAWYFEPCNDGYYSELKGVTHWQPLPGSPKGEE